jgi:hypothetical protein
MAYSAAFSTGLWVAAFIFAHLYVAFFALKAVQQLSPVAWSRLRHAFKRLRQCGEWLKPDEGGGGMEMQCRARARAHPLPLCAIGR